MKQNQTYQTDLFSGSHLRDVGIEIAVSNAESKIPDWKNITWELFKEFLQTIDEPFMMESFRSFLAMKEDYEFPPVNMAFGFIPLKAAKEGLIKKIGYGKVTNVKAHATPASVWQRI